MSEGKKNNIFIILWVLLLIVFILLVLRLYLYGNAIRFYNQGNDHFAKYDYTTAESRYSRALIDKHSKRMDCKMRINEALSITTSITPESVNAENLDEAISRLQSAIDILTANGCAHESDSNGHNKKAQTLKDEIEEYIEWLKENKSEPENDENDENDEQQDQEKDDLDEADKKGAQEKTEQQKKQESLKETFKSIQEDSMGDRMHEQSLYDNLGKYSYYDGKSW